MVEELMEMGLTKEEAEETINLGFDGCLESGDIVRVFDSAEELGQHYLDNVVGRLNYHIEAVLDIKKLGNQIANSDDEYEMLSTGKIVEFAM